jgi:hypothetical protein
MIIPKIVLEIVPTIVFKIIFGGVPKIGEIESKVSLS